MIRSEWMGKMLKAYAATLGILRRIESETGYQYKEPIDVDITDYKVCPMWENSRIEIGYNNDPESIAHEIAHGLHEKIRETGRPDKFGEEFADAIRFYVETQLCNNSDWIKHFDKSKNLFINRYIALDQFIDALKNQRIFTDTSWT